MLQRSFALLILLCVMLALTQWEDLKTRGELKFRKIREQWKAIGSIIFFQTVIILSGASVTVFFLLNFIDGFEGFGFGQRLVISIIFSIICVARSPSSTIAIISETKSKG